MAATPDYTILHRPRISASTFARVLTRAGSPAAPSAAAAYAAAVSYGVDPAVLLAIFQHESNYGKTGRATGNKSWGNARTSSGSFPRVDGFVRYPSWIVGARDASRLLRIYGLNQIRPGRNTSTVRKLPFVWAPAADGNAPARYGDALVRAIAGYIKTNGGEETSTPPKPPKPIPTTSTHKAVYDDVLIRTGPTPNDRNIRTIDAGTKVRVDRTITNGGAYDVHGRGSRTWHRITAISGRRLASPVWSAALLYDRL